MQLLKSQKTILYDILVGRGFLPSMFELEDLEIQRNMVTKIKHSQTDYFFSTFCTDQGYFYFTLSPGVHKLIASSQTQSWQFLVENFIEWLSSLKREIEVVDKWQQLKTVMPNFKVMQSNTQDKFSYNEVLLIQEKVKLLKTKILEIPLTASQLETLNEKLDYCVEFAKTANKFDWGSYFLGVITNIILTLSVTPSNAHLIWEAIKAVFNTFLLN